PGSSGETRGETGRPVKQALSPARVFGHDGFAMPGRSRGGRVMRRRMTVAVVLFGLAALLALGQRPGPVSAQAKKDAVVEKLRAELQQAERQITVLRQEAAQLQAANNKLQAELKKAGNTVGGDATAMKGLQSTIDGYRNAGLVHVVVFKLK